MSGKLSAEALTEHIATAWLKHQGYDDAEIEKGMLSTHRGSGCELVYPDWDCDLNGRSRHPEMDAVIDAGYMAAFVEELLRPHIDAQQAEIEALTRRNVAMEDRIAARAVRSTARVPDCEYGCDLDTFGTHQDDCPFDAEAVARRARHASDS